MIDGLFAVLGKFANWFPKKEEKLRNDIQSYKREMDAISKRECNIRNTNRYNILADRLWKAEQALQNRA